SVALAARTRLYKAERPLDVSRELVRTEDYVAQEFDVSVSVGEAVTVEKVVALFGSRDRAIHEPGYEARNHVKRSGDFADLLVTHILAWDHLWQRFGIEVETGNGDVQCTLNLHVFHLLQTVSPNSVDLDVGVPARGLHGEAYRGHIFWDEVFIFPYLTLHMPRLTRGLLQYRFRRLPKARWHAADAGFRGALFPWQSGSNGEEETQEWHLNPLSGEWSRDNSHLQRHVDIAVAYSVWRYYSATGDDEFMENQGAEMLLEVAGFLASLCVYNRTEDRYEILGVMGPDEYHDGYPDAPEPGVNNNAYTNVMAVWCLMRALSVFEVLPSRRRLELRERLGIGRDDL
ncbi:MAG: glycoside hydrolase family 65 protein, partial [Actinomycetota bacterium]|nr:glycoside hydrolase family 65 protein [Actinomycetota bacterium]